MREKSDKRTRKMLIKDDHKRLMKELFPALGPLSITHQSFSQTF